MRLEEHGSKANLLGFTFYPEPVLKQSFIMIPRYRVNLWVLSFVRTCENCWLGVSLVLTLMTLHLHSFLKALPVG